MKRILVIGSPGSGKSTFARALRDAAGLPLIYMDQLFWNADKTNVSRETLCQRLREVMAQECWIIDGHYAGTLEMRLQQCDTVFWLDYPLEVCLAGIENRRGTIREDLPWVETEPDSDFIAYVQAFHEKTKPELPGLLKSFPHLNVIRFTDRDQADAFLKEWRER